MELQDIMNKTIAQGTDAEIEVFEGLPHGFGLGEGTVAEGWFDNFNPFCIILFLTVKEK